MQHVYLLTLPESFASGVLGARDLLNFDRTLVNLLEESEVGEVPAFHTELVGMKRTMETSGGPPLSMDRTLEETGEADVIYVSPLLVSPDWTPEFDPALLDWLRTQYASGAVLCSACTGTLPLAASGLLDGLPATTHWAFTEQFRALYPAVDLLAHRTLIVGGDDRRLITAGAHASWYDLMLYLIHRFAGVAMARHIARFFLLDWHDLDQNAYASFRENLQHGDTVILRGQQWLRDNLSHPEPVETAIAHTGLSQRSFHRRFRQATGHTPIRYVQQLRIERAKCLLENSDGSVEEVAWQVGYEDAAFFRRLFRRITGVTPSKYRKAFRTPPDLARQLG